MSRSSSKVAATSYYGLIRTSLGLVRPSFLLFTLFGHLDYRDFPIFYLLQNERQRSTPVPYHTLLFASMQVCDESIMEFPDFHTSPARQTDEVWVHF